MRLLLLLLLLLLPAACATAKPVEERISFSVDVERLGVKGKECGKRLEVAYGPLPRGVSEVERLVVTASRPAPLGEIEDVLRAHAKKACADGIVVLLAVVDDGGTLASSVTAVAWVHDLSRPPNSPSISD
jgi:hypothetical protein